MGLVAVGLSLPVQAAKNAEYLPVELKRVGVMLPAGEKYGYIFIGNGKWVIPPQFEAADYTFNRDTGLAAVKIGGKYGFINMQGKVVIPAQFDEVGWSWSDDRMAVKIGQQTGFIDPAGKLVIGLQSGQVNAFSDGLASVYEGYKTRFIDRYGAVAFEVAGSCGYFYDGLASVTSDKQGSLETGFINKKGQIVIKPRTALFLSRFTEGRAAVKVGNKYGFIDPTGKLVIPAQYDCAQGFREGLAPVLVGEKIGFIDLQGNMVLAAQYEYPDKSWQPQIALGNSIFHRGHATVKWNGKFGIINKTGGWVVQPYFNSYIALYERQQVVFTNDYYYDINGKKLDHYVNHMLDGDLALNNGDKAAAAVFFRKALKINSGDKTAARKLSLAEGPG